MNAVEFEKDIFCWKNLLYRLAIRILDNTAEAEDAVQSTMIKMWQKKDTLHNIENLRAFVIKSLRNDCLNRLKKMDSTGRLKANFGSLQYYSIDNSGSNMVDVIKEEIKKLPEKQKMIIQLADVEGFDSREIAGILGMEEGAVRTNLSRARQKVQMQIIKLQEYEERRL